MKDKIMIRLKSAKLRRWYVSPYAGVIYQKAAKIAQVLLYHLYLRSPVGATTFPQKTITFGNIESNANLGRFR